MNSFFKFKNLTPGMVVYTSNPSTQEQRQVDLCDFKANLIYIASPSTVRASKQVNEDLQQIYAKLIQLRVLVRFLKGGRRADTTPFIYGNLVDGKSHFKLMGEG